MKHDESLRCRGGDVQVIGPIQAVSFVQRNEAIRGLPSEPRLERRSSGALQIVSERRGQDLSRTEEDRREERGEASALKAWSGGSEITSY
jgi:hypothetical protein